MNKTKYIEKFVISDYCILLLISLIIIGNITSFQFYLKDFFKQFIWVLICIPVFILFLKLNLEKLRFFAFPLMLLGLILLGIVLIQDSQRWISLKIIQFQPSTLARLILIFYLVHYIDKNKDKLHKSNPIEFIKYHFPLLLFPILYLILIFLEPDLSTSFILFLIFLSLLFLAHIKFSTVFLIAFAAVLFLSIYLMSNKGYKNERFVAFTKFITGKKLDENNELRFYQPKESLIALSHGKVFGKGSNEGRAKLFYLPFAKTDYILAILGEEYGFVGTVFLLMLYFLLIFCCFILAYKTQNFFYALLIIGLTLNLTYNIIINISVVTSLIPPTGVSLPFISYGGSALLVDSISIALIINSSRKSKKLKFYKSYAYA